MKPFHTPDPVVSSSDVNTARSSSCSTDSEDEDIDLDVLMSQSTKGDESPTMQQTTGEASDTTLCSETEWLTDSSHSVMVNGKELRVRLQIIDGALVVCLESDDSTKTPKIVGIAETETIWLDDGTRRVELRVSMQIE